MELHEMFLGTTTGATKTGGRTQIVIPNVWVSKEWLPGFYECFMLSLERMYTDPKVRAKELQRDHLYTRLNKVGDRWIPEF